jgi:DNA (cytosine-5)-methyltransferase 1
MKILELFSGYGTATFALKRLGIPHEIVGYSDIDKYANQCFQQNHCGKQLGDVKLVNPNDLPDFDLLTGGFPCQAFSVAGKGLGELDPRGTLFYEIIRIAEVKKPKYMLLENVKGLTNKTHKATFNKILSELDRIGYKVYWKVLNSKDFGIPQSRARVWFVCFRKDIDKGFEFPEPVELKIFIKDILEENVDPKYYLSEKLQERFAKYLEEKQFKTNSQYDTNMSIPEIGEANRIYGVNGVCPPLKHHTLKIYDRKGFDSRTKGFRENDLSPTLSTKMGTGGNNVPMVQDVANTIKVGGRVTKPNFYYEKKQDNFVVSNTITQAVGRIGHSSEELGYIENNMKCGQLRRLTPKECFRLMGFLNDEINLEGLSDTQRYKLAGNGQDVNMVSLIFKEMFQ